MSKQNPQRLTTAFLNNLKPNPTIAKSTDYEVNLSAMKDSGLPIGVRCLVGKSGNKRFLLRYTSPVTGKKASISLGKHPETELNALRKLAREYRQKILEGVDPKLERDNKVADSSMTLERFFEDVYVPLAKQKKLTWRHDIARFRLAKSIHHVPINELTPSHIIKVQLELFESTHKAGKKYAVATINRVLALLKTINKQAYRLMDAPFIADKISLTREDNVRTGYLSESEL